MVKQGKYRCTSKRYLKAGLLSNIYKDKPKGPFVLPLPNLQDTTAPTFDFFVDELDYQLPYDIWEWGLKKGGTKTTAAVTWHQCCTCKILLQNETSMKSHVETKHELKAGRRRRDWLPILIERVPKLTYPETMASNRDTNPYDVESVECTPSLPDLDSVDFESMDEKQEDTEISISETFVDQHLNQSGNELKQDVSNECSPRTDSHDQIFVEEEKHIDNHDYCYAARRRSRKKELLQFCTMGWSNSNDISSNQDGRRSSAPCPTTPLDVVNHSSPSEIDTSFPTPADSPRSSVTETEAENDAVDENMKQDTTEMLIAKRESITDYPVNNMQLSIIHPQPEVLQQVSSVIFAHGKAVQNCKTAERATSENIVHKDPLFGMSDHMSHVDTATIRVSYVAKVGDRQEARRHVSRMETVHQTAFPNSPDGSWVQTSMSRSTISVVGVPLMPIIHGNILQGPINMNQVVHNHFPAPYADGTIRRADGKVPAIVQYPLNTSPANHTVQGNTDGAMSKIPTHQNVINNGIGRSGVSQYYNQFSSRQSTNKYSTVEHPEIDPLAVCSTIIKPEDEDICSDIAEVPKGRNFRCGSCPQIFDSVRGLQFHQIEHITFFAGETRNESTRIQKVESASWGMAKVEDVSQPNPMQNVIDEWRDGLAARNATENRRTLEDSGHQTSMSRVPYKRVFEMPGYSVPPPTKMSRYEDGELKPENNSLQHQNSIGSSEGNPGIDPATLSSAGFHDRFDFFLRRRAATFGGSFPNTRKPIIPPSFRNRHMQTPLAKSPPYNSAHHCDY